MSLDFAGLAASLLAHSEAHCLDWLPEGRRAGQEWCVGSIAGEAGQSLRINLSTGIWRDFASDEGGADLVALYAAVHKVSQGDAFKALSNNSSVIGAAVTYNKKELYKPVKPNGAASGFEALHPQHGLPHQLHRYLDAGGELLFYVARYETPAGKTFLPWTYDGSKWRAKGWPAPRPLYGLDLVDWDPDVPVLLFEGELKTDRARHMLPSWLCLSWAGGAAGVNHTDFKPLSGKAVTLWPDADEVGREAMFALAGKLKRLGAAVQIIDTRSEREGWDVADFIAEGATSAALNAYIREHARGLAEFTLERADHKPTPTTREPTASPGGSSVGTAPKTDGENSDAVAVTVSRLGEQKLPLFATEWECWKYFDLARGPGNRPWANLDNILRILAKHPDLAGRFRYDLFADRVMKRQESGEWCAYDTRSDSTRLAITLQRMLHMAAVKPVMVEEALEAYAREDAYHPVREWLAALPPWDGASRVNELFILGFGAPDTPYTRAVGHSFMGALIQRACEPGCTVRTLPVLEGKQYTGKSTALEALGGQWYLDCQHRVDSPAFLQAIQGYWLIEWSELAGMMKSGAEEVKSCISRKNDVYRTPYDRRPAAHLRQCVFAGSTNTFNWQIDETGGSRFLPIRCGEISVPWCQSHREQLFAEALSRYRAREPWHLIPREQAEEAQLERHVEHPWLDIIRDYCEGRTQVMSRDILQFALEIPPERRGQKEANAVAKCLQTLGWSAKNLKDADRNAIRVYKKSWEAS